MWECSRSEGTRWGLDGEGRCGRGLSEGRPALTLVGMVFVFNNVYY